MTLDEAIKHAEEVAEEEEKQTIWLQSEGNPNYDNCVKRTEEHRQLVAWLKELKGYRETNTVCIDGDSVSVCASHTKNYSR